MMAHGGQITRQRLVAAVVRQVYAGVGRRRGHWQQAGCTPLCQVEADLMGARQLPQLRQQL
jgi:hypothetical protein